MRGRGAKRGSNAPNTTVQNTPADGLEDAALVEAMRRGDEEAYRSFFFRFAPLIGFFARVYRIPRAERTTVVTDFLEDMALRLSQRTVAVPRVVSAYLIASFKHRLHNRVRAEHTRARVSEELAAEVGASSQRVVYGASSEHAIHAASGALWDEGSHDEVLERLALVLDNELSAEERRIMTWLGRRVPQRDIAKWLGVSHGALRTRVMRLRARLRVVALIHVESLIDEERAQIEGFLRRVGVASPEPRRVTTGAGSEKESPDE